MSRDDTSYLQKRADFTDTVESNVTFSGTTTFTGTTNLGAVGQSATTVTSNSANALAVGPNGTTNPTLKINAATASAATGLTVVGAAAAGGVAVSAISSGTNENLTLDAKGSGTVIVNGTATGGVTLARNTGVTGTLTGTSASASALTVGPNGATNPTLKVDASTASAATGLQVKSNAAGSNVTISAVSSGTDEAMKIAGKGNGSLILNNNSTIVTSGGSVSSVGSVNAANATAITAGGSTTGFKFSSTANFGVFGGSGAPTIAAAKGSLYLRSDGSGTSDRAYINTDGSTTWTAITTAA